MITRVTLEPLSFLKKCDKGRRLASLTYDIYVWCEASSLEPVRYVKARIRALTIHICRVKTRDMARPTRRPQELLTIKQLVRRCAPPNEQRVGLWERRLRHWAVQGILPVAQPSRGSRNARMFGAEAVHLAAVLLRISDFGLETNILAEVSSYIQTNSLGSGKFARFWKRAFRPDINTQEYLFIYIPPETYPQPNIGWYGQVRHSVIIPDIGLAPALLLDLRQVSRELRSLEVEEG